MTKQVKLHSYIAKYPVPRSVQSALKFTFLADLSQLLRQTTSHAAINAQRLFK